MKQFQITLRNRHLRYVFFIDKQYPYEKLVELICLNQKYWGGRFNPIIPVEDNTISERYRSLIKHYDPDYVFFSNGIDPDIIKSLRIFNPIGYYNLDEQPRKEDVKGVDALYLLSPFKANSKIILPSELWKTKNVLLEYYQINFGLESNLLFSDYEIGKNYQQTIIDKDNLTKLNQILHKEKPANQAHLSRLNLNTRILRNLQHTNYDDFEIVISKDKTTILDLIYFWNRMLYGGRNILYLTVEELHLLSEDKFWGGVLYDMSSTSPLYVVSMTLDKNAIDDLIRTKLTPIAFNRQFKYKDIHDFPFEILDANGLYERDFGESPTLQTLISNQGLLYLPKLSFTNKVEFHSQEWAMDVEIRKFGENYQNDIKVPYTTDTHFILKDVKGRVNQRRNITVLLQNYHQNNANAIEVKIPEFSDLMRQLIMHPFIDGEVQNSKYCNLGPHDPSNKLSAFLKAFNYDFHTVDDFFTDIFWVTLFEELSISEKQVGDSIQFNEIKTKALGACKDKGIEFGEKEKTYLNEENLELGLKETIKELCSYRVFLKGFNLKCPKCSSEFWYHIKEVNDTVNCKGCFVKFELPIEPAFSYKLNDLIKNNIFQSKKSRDGNLTVIRTLVYLQKTCRQSFAYNPQINLFDDCRLNKPSTDIDIVCLVDGQLIIGEAKHDSTAFSENKNKSLNSLVEVAKVIRPDKIILSCYVDPKEKLDKAKQGLIHIFNKWEYQPEIEILRLHTPDDFNIGGHRYFFH